MSSVQDQYMYPPIEPYNQGLLPVSGGHRIYYEQSGNPLFSLYTADLEPDAMPMTVGFSTPINGG